MKYTKMMTITTKPVFIYATFYARSENEIDRMIEGACYILLHYYPHLDISGGAFEENPLDVA